MQCLSPSCVTNSEIVKVLLKGKSLTLFHLLTFNLFSFMDMHENTVTIFLFQRQKNQPNPCTGACAGVKIGRNISPGQSCTGKDDLSSPFIYYYWKVSTGQLQLFSRHMSIPVNNQIQDLCPPFCHWHPSRSKLMVNRDTVYITILAKFWHFKVAAAQLWGSWVKDMKRLQLNWFQLKGFIHVC